MQFSKSLGKQASYYRKALPGFFLCIFSSLTSLKKPVFSKRDLLWWKVHTSQALLGCFWPTEGTSQPITISETWKNPSSAFHRKRTWVQAVLWFSICSLGLPAWDTDLKSRKGLYLGPSPIHSICLGSSFSWKEILV